MALLHICLQLWPGRVRAVTVDHGLRPESADEARAVAAFCAARAIPHDTLRWSGPASAGNLMDQARQARAALIADWARGKGIGHVLLGHTADDQAETLVMNLARAAGLDGLAGLRPEWRAQGITWHRPLLGIGRAALRDHLRAHGLGWAEDPSNENDRFARARVRKALAVLSGLGVSTGALASTAAHLAKARAALDQTLAEVVRADVTEAAGAVYLPCDRLARLAPELRRRLLRALTRWMGGAAHPPREAQLARLALALADRRDATLAGLRFRHQGAVIRITREPRAQEGPVPFGQVWDHRWHLRGPALEGLQIAALGSAGLPLCPGWRDHGPRDVLAVTPALWQGGRLIAAPLAGLGADWQAETAPCLHSFILSH